MDKHGIFEPKKRHRPKHQGIPIFQTEAPKSSAVTLSNFLPRSSVMYLQAAKVGTFLWPCGLTLEEDQDIMGLKMGQNHMVTWYDPKLFEKMIRQTKPYYNP